ncbi:MAG: hypothetical protein SA339_08990 [Methanomassiliicoccus sp.]|nr:hypothetical protein [Methanomassiliicoccus sp.]
MASIRRCRRCGGLFVPGYFGLNLFVVRIRRCGACGKLTPLYIWGDGTAAPELEAESTAPEMASESEEETLKRRIEESKYER